MHRSRSGLSAALLLALVLVVGLLLPPSVALAAQDQDEILRQTATIRGLTPRRAVPFAFVDAETLRQNLLTSYNDQAAVRELETSRKLMVALGLLSPDADLHGMLVDLYAENILGYYSSEDKKMYVISGTADFDPQTRMTLAHEFTHALQDQYFDLTSVLSEGEQNGDRSLAVTALVEGDATLTMIQYAREFLTPQDLLAIQLQSSQSTLDRAPLVVRDELSFPYNEGALFAIQLWQEGGYAALNEAFANPPVSTEQVLHPEKYLIGEQPVDVQLPDLAAALGDGWSQLRADVLGELDLRILLQQFTDPALAERGAEGWGGDRFALLQNEAGETALVVKTVWDDESQAGEFFNAYVEAVRHRYGGRAQKTLDAASQRLWTTPNGSLLLQKAGSEVLLVMAPDDAVVGRLMAALSNGAPAPAVPAPVQAPRR